MLGSSAYDDENLYEEEAEERAMFGNKYGVWSLTSKKDHRFNVSGHGVVGGFVLPPEATEEMKQKARSLRCKIPDDLVYRYTKD